MKANQIKQESNEKSVPELSLMPIGSYEELKTDSDGYDGGFHIQSSVAKNRVVSKRSALQGFTCR